MKRIFSVFKNKKEKMTSKQGLDLELRNAPDYVKKYVTKIFEKGPSSLLLNGDWCGHGEEIYRVYDVSFEENKIYSIFLPDDETDELLPKAVKLQNKNDDFNIYDSRKHPASLYSLEEYQNLDTKFKDSYKCPKCHGINFTASIGYEVPEDSSSNEDISWFILSAECVNCNEKSIVYEDETA